VPILSPPSATFSSPSRIPFFCLAPPSSPLHLSVWFRITSPSPCSFFSPICLPFFLHLLFVLYLFSLLCKTKKGTGEMVENTCPLEIRKHPPQITKSSNRFKGRITTALLKFAEKLLLIHSNLKKYICLVQGLPH